MQRLRKVERLHECRPLGSGGEPGGLRVHEHRLIGALLERALALHEHAIMMRTAVTSAGITDERGLHVRHGGAGFGHGTLDRTERIRRWKPLPGQRHAGELALLPAFIEWPLERIEYAR